MGSSRSRTLPPDWSSLARWTRFRSPPDSVADELLLVRAPEVEAGHVGPRRDLALADLDELDAVGDLLEHGPVRAQLVAALVHVAELHGVADLMRPGVGRLLADEHPEQRRLAGAVGADDADDAGPRQRERQVLDEQPVAVPLAQVLDLDDGVAQARTGRNGDLELAGAALVVLRLGEQLLVGAEAGLALGLPRPGPTGGPTRARGRACAGGRRPSSTPSPCARASAPASSSSCRRTGSPGRGPAPGSTSRRCRGSSGRG